MKTNFVRLAAAASVTLGLAACGGSPDSTEPGERVVLSCGAAGPLLAVFAPDGDGVIVETDRGPVRLDRARSASGARYVGAGHELWEKGGTVLWTPKDGPARTCAWPGRGAPGDGRVAIANPASVHCTEQGGQLVTETLPNGSEFGVCVFTDNRQCGQWALFRGACPVGGLRVAGYPTDAARFCAITGGDYRVSDTGTETCVTPAGAVCPVEAYHRGDCPDPT